GLIGVMIGMWLFSLKYNHAFLEIADLLAPVVPFGIFMGRFGNFINGELWGNVTQVPWGMVFPEGGSLPRHPSQLYAMALEGILMFILLWWYGAKPRERGAVSGLFLILYALIRIFEEIFRQPDPQYGYLAFGWVTMGQVLSVPMLILGIFLFWFSKHSARFKCPKFK
ncbi:MAG TPA: prolipoprotein diacylglyceryl transferase, partial [Gammaproteobacteria bacterium]|nr:prolipoprotein diacylglyceryl transferase [Gammaproteobacteria bacterium]